MKIFVFDTNVVIKQEVLWDLGFVVLPENDRLRTITEVIFWLIVIIGGIFVFIPSIIKHPTVLSSVTVIRFCKVSGFGIILRTICFLSTSAPGPSPECRISSNEYDPPTSWKDILFDMTVADGCGDLVFSGHLSLTLTIAICVSHYSYFVFPKIWKVISFGILLLVLILALLIITTRNHYTLDIIVASYTVPLLYHFLWYKLPDPDINQLIMQKQTNVDSDIIDVIDNDNDQE